MNQFLNKINRYNPNKVIFISLIIWFILNLLQAGLSELAHDEAYYWMYSKNLAWGYFDHPPVIAVMIKLGYFLFKNEFGVRLMSCILSVLSVFIIYKLTDTAQKSTLVFVLLIFSIAIGQTHAFGFLAIPDNPIVFFSALFLLILKRYLEEDSWLTALFLSLIAALMLYSKYHAVLVFLFSIIPNFHLFKRKSFYVIPVLTSVLLLPHLFWQIRNGFPTFEYHLVSRASAYTPLHTWNYLYSQFLIVGPFVTIPLFYHAFKAKIETAFERTLKFVFIGFFVFFFLMSFRGHIEAHWTAIAIIPLIILAYKSISESENAKKWIVRLSIPSIVFIIFVRLVLAFPILPPNVSTVKEFHNWKKWAKEIQKLADGRKVVFTNSFQRPAKYSFYTGEISHSNNNLRYRKNQYDIWNYEDSLTNAPVIIFNGEHSRNKILTATQELYTYDTLGAFVDYNHYKIISDKKKVILGPNKMFIVKVDIKNTRPDVKFNNPDSLTTFLSAVMVDAHKLYPVQELKKLSMPLNHNENQYVLSIKSPPFIGEYQCYISLHNEKTFPGFNSIPMKIIVK